LIRAFERHGSEDQLDALFGRYEEAEEKEK